MSDQLFIYLHTLDGLGLAIRRGAIISVQENPGGDLTIHLKDGQWRIVAGPYVEVTKHLQEDT